MFVYLSLVTIMNPADTGLAISTGVLGGGLGLLIGLIVILVVIYLCCCKKVPQKTSVELD